MLRSLRVLSSSIRRSGRICINPNESVNHPQHTKKRYTPVREEGDDCIDGWQKNDSDYLSLLKWSIVVATVTNDVDESKEARYSGCRACYKPADLVCVPIAIPKVLLLDGSRIVRRAPGHHEGYIMAPGPGVVMKKR